MAGGRIAGPFFGEEFCQLTLRLLTGGAGLRPVPKGKENPYPRSMV